MENNDKISTDMDNAIEKVSAELEHNDNPGAVEDTPAKEVAKGGSEESPKAEPFVADDALTERAIRAGLSMKDVKAFTSAEFAESILSHLEAKPKSKEAKGNEERVDDVSPTDEFDKVLEKMESEGDFNEDFLKMFKGMSSLLKAQAKELKELKESGKSAEAKSFLDKQISTLGEGVAKHLDAAHKSKLDAKFKFLKKAYASAGSNVSNEEVFKEAAKLAIGDILDKAAAESKAAKAAERRNLTLARPGGEQGQHTKSGAPSLDDIVEAVAKELG